MQFVHAQPISWVMLTTDASQNVLHTLIVQPIELVSETNVVILVKEFVDEMLNVELTNFLTRLFALAQGDTLDIHLNPVNHKNHKICAHLPHVEPMLNVNLDETIQEKTDQFAHVFQDTLEML